MALLSQLCAAFLIFVLTFAPWDAVPLEVRRVTNHGWFKLLVLVGIVTLSEKGERLCAMYVAIVYVVMSREQIHTDLPRTVDLQ
jgi:hypothetical protein